MLFFCEYSAVPGTRREAVRRRMYTLHHSTGNRQDCIEHWYEFTAGLSGFVICECDDLAELEAALEPYRDLLHFHVRELVGEVNYEDRFGPPRVVRDPDSAVVA